MKPKHICLKQLTDWRYKVFSCEGPVWVLLSDGELRIKALLSASAVQSFQDELGDDEFNLDLRGDILLLKEFSIISTPYGPEDGFVQIHVSKLEYVKTIRKVIGQPRAVQEFKSIQALVDQIRQVRDAGYSGVDEVLGPDFVPVETASDIPDVVDPQLGSPASPASQFLRSSPPALPSPNPPERHAPDVEDTVFDSQLVQDHFYTQANEQTRSTARVRRRGTSFTRGGLHIEAGVNLSMPQPPGMSHRRRSVAQDQPKPGQSYGHGKLLSLLSKGKQIANADTHAPASSSRSQLSLVAETPPKTKHLIGLNPVAEPAISDSLAQQESGRILKRKTRSSPDATGPADATRRRSTVPEEDGARKLSSPLTKANPQEPRESDEDRDPFPVSGNARAGGTGERFMTDREPEKHIETHLSESGSHHIEDDVTSAQQQHGRKTASARGVIQSEIEESRAADDSDLSFSSKKPASLRRHKIPVDQLNLLEKKSSWIPAMPGEIVPHPNVPIQLLTLWNEKQAALIEPTAMHPSSPSCSLPEPQLPPPQPVLPASTTGTDSSESIEWPATSSPDTSPMRRQHALPPDSSAVDNRPPQVPMQHSLPPNSSDESPRHVPRAGTALAQRGLPPTTPAGPWHTTRPSPSVSQQSLDGMPLAIPRALSSRASEGTASSRHSAAREPPARVPPDRTLLDSPGSRSNSGREHELDVQGSIPHRSSQGRDRYDTGLGRPFRGDYYRPSQDGRGPSLRDQRASASSEASFHSNNHQPDPQVLEQSTQDRALQSSYERAARDYIPHRERRSKFIRGHMRREW